MDRRKFLKRLRLGAAAVAGATVGVVDPARWLWTPGKTTHIPPPASGWLGSLAQQYRNGAMSQMGWLDWFQDANVEQFALPHGTASADLALSQEAFAEALKERMRAASEALADEIDRRIVGMYQAPVVTVAAQDELTGISVRFVREFTVGDAMPPLPEGLPPHAYVAARKLWESVHPPLFAPSRFDMLTGFATIRPSLIARVDS